MSDQLALTKPARQGAVANPNNVVRQQVPAFLNKLYSMVNDPATDNLIRWSPEGDSFLVPDHERFGRELLPRFFKHGNFSSFVRQLNMYGFHKVPHLQQGVLQNETETELWQFVSPHFQRGQPDLLTLIQRKKAVTGAGATGEEGGSVVAATTNPPAGAASLDLGSIAGGLAAIKRHQTIISAELKDIQQSNAALWQEAVAARERHKKHQDTINRILKFLAGVFGNNVGAQSPGASPGSGNNGGGSVVPRKRPRLMIQDSGSASESDRRPHKKKAEPAVEEVADDWGEDDELVTMDVEERHPNEAARIAEMPSPSAASPSLSAARIESVASTPASTVTEFLRPPQTNQTVARRQPSRAANTSNISPSPSPVPHPSFSDPSFSDKSPSAHALGSSAPGLANSTAGSDPSGSGPSYQYPQMTLNPYTASNPNYSMMPISNNMGSTSNNNPADIQAILNSPNSLRRMLSALSAQSAIPNIPSMPPSFDNSGAAMQSQYNPPPTTSDTGTAEGNAIANNNGQQLIPGGGAYLNYLPSGLGMGYDPTNTSNITNGTDPMLALLNYQQSQPNQGFLTDIGLSSNANGAAALEQLGANTDNFQRVYKDAATINADVDAIQQSINSLIQSMGLDPAAMGSLHEDHPIDPSLGNPLNGGVPTSNGMTEGDGAGVDFDAFLNQFSNGAVPDMMDGGDDQNDVDMEFPFGLEQQAAMSNQANRMSGMNGAHSQPFDTSAFTNGSDVAGGEGLSRDEPLRGMSAEIRTASTTSSPVHNMVDDVAVAAEPNIPGATATKAKGGKRKSDVVDIDRSISTTQVSAGAKKTRPKKRK